MNTAIKRDGKPTGGYVLAMENNLLQAKGNQRTLLLVGGLLVLLIAAISIGYSLYAHRSAAAATAFGQAMQVYQTPVARPDQPVPPGIKTFPSVKERATQANDLFAQVANRYNLTEPGKIAQYFVGLTLMEQGNLPAAEASLTKTAKGWNADTAALGKLALAQLYQHSGRDSQAIALYGELAKGHASTVPPGLAQIQLAELYNTEGKTEQARQIYAALKDHDKDAKGKLGVAGQVASGKLNPQPAPGAPGLQAR